MEDRANILNMKLMVQKFIEDCLANAEYSYDKKVGQWVGWIKTLPGVYAQGDSVESVRQELAEMSEEHLFLSLREKRAVRGLSFKSVPAYA